MTEEAARQTLLVRAWERDPAARASWSDADRAWATDAAARVVGEQAAVDVFVARRAALAVERLGSRHPLVPRLLEAVKWRPWIGFVVVALALIAGLVADAAGSARHINLLAPPLLGLIAWNLFVYLLILARGVSSVFGRPSWTLGPLSRGLARLGHAASRPFPGHDAGLPAAAFLEDWARASGTLTAARIGRVLHTGAAAFAIGTLGGMYLRGLAFEYRAGWESTFLDARAVRAVLGAVLGPASALTGIGLPDTAGYEALRFAAGPGVVAASWVHLFAVTVAIVVLAPRALLALGDAWVERRQSAHFPLRLDGPYFERLLRAFRRVPAAVRVVPYSYRLSPQVTRGLNRLLVGALGPRTEVRVVPDIAFGDEDAMDPAALAGGANVIALVFALTATPEAENHGVFIDTIARSVGDAAHMVALVDESEFRRRFAGDDARLAARRELWARFLQDRRCASAFVDLEAPDEAADTVLQAALDAQGSGR